MEENNSTFVHAEFLPRGKNPRKHHMQIVVCVYVEDSEVLTVDIARQNRKLAIKNATANSLGRFDILTR